MQKSSITAKTYTYNRLMMEGEYIQIFTDNSKWPSDHYIGRGEYENWPMEGYTVEGFATKIASGVIEVTEVPHMIPADEIDQYVLWSKVAAKVEHIRIHGFNVSECPHCSSTNIEIDGEEETDGCAQDWATWQHWSQWCNDCPDFKASGQYVTQSGGSY